MNTQWLAMDNDHRSTVSSVNHVPKYQKHDVVIAFSTQHDRSGLPYMQSSIRIQLPNIHP